MTRFRLALLCATIALVAGSTGVEAASAKPLGFTARYGFHAKISVANSGTMPGSVPVDGEFHITLQQYKDGTPKELTFGLDRLASDAMDQTLKQGKGVIGKSFSLLFDRSGRLTGIKPAIPGVDVKKLLDAKSGLEIRYHGGAREPVGEQLRAIPAGTALSTSFTFPRGGSGENAQDKLIANLRFLGVSQDGANADMEFDLEFDSAGSLATDKEPGDSPGKAGANVKIRGKASFELSRGLLSYLGVEGAMSHTASGTTLAELGVNFAVTLLELTDLK